MFNGSGVFTYVGKRRGVTKDNINYLAFDVITNDNSKSKISFIATNENVINQIWNTDFHDFQDIKLHFCVNRIFNREKRASYWEVILIGVD